MTLKTLSTTALLLSLTTLAACGTSIDDPLSGDDEAEALDGEGDGADDGEEVATSESAATTSAVRSGSPRKVTDLGCLDEKFPMSRIATNGMAFTFAPIAKSNLGWCQKWIFESKKCKWTVAKCACSGGPECKMQAVQGCFNSHDSCNAAVKQACANCPASCTKAAKGCS